MRTAHRLVVALLASALLSTACGARLSDEQRQEALTQFGSGTGGNGVSVSETEVVDDAADEELAAGEPGGVETATEMTGGTEGTEGTAGTEGTEGGGGEDAGDGGGGGGGGDTRQAPPGGNGGATDKGVTADTIVLSNVSDVSGAVPGLFEDAQLAAKAYVAYFTAKEGTIYGRKLKLIALDSRLDAGAARSASLQACNESFGSIGSVSAFDQGAAPVIKDCGIPDLRGLSTTNAMKTVPNAFPTNAAGTGGSRSLGMFGWAADKFPEAIKKAAYVYIDGEVTRQLQAEDAEGAKALLGYNWIYEPAIGITETNYGPVVQQLKSRGAEYVTFTGAYQQAVALAQEFQRQNYKPTVYQPTVTAYTPNYLQSGGSAVEGSYVTVVPSLLEEIQGNPELTLYAQWLNQVKPGAKPTAIGQFAWAASALFVEKLKEIGPKPTRKALLATIPKIRSYTGNGLFAAQDVGGRRLSSCTAVVQVKGGKFVRIEPTAVRSYRCKDPIYNTKTKKAEKGFPE
jgi:ABC-type branched-subunit amino acid transport system substrate-binding protein